MLAWGYTVSVPFGVARYDLIAEINGELKRIQCKTGRLVNGAIEVKVVSRGYTGKGYRNKVYHGEIDLFGIYCPQTDKCYLVPIGNQMAAICLRIDPPKNNRVTGVRWAKDFEI